MDERKNRPDPTHGYQNQTFEQEFAARFDIQGVDAKENTDSANEPAKDTEHDPTPPEALIRTWDRITQHANGIMAVFTILIFFATSAYSVIAILQWCAMRDQLHQMERSNDLLSKQMEGLNAADVAIANSETIYIDFPVPPNGAARWNFINTGGVFARNVNAEITVKFHGSKDRTLLSRSESIPTLARSASAVRPDFIYPFSLTGNEYDAILKSRAYITAEGAYRYNNGFNEIPARTFCKGYIWGDNHFGRWVGDCPDIDSELAQARQH